jgi:hypothetical protein
VIAIAETTDRFPPKQLIDFSEIGIPAVRG